MLGESDEMGFIDHPTSKASSIPDKKLPSVTSSKQSIGMVEFIVNLTT